MIRRKLKEYNGVIIYLNSFILMVDVSSKVRTIFISNGGIKNLFLVPFSASITKRTSNIMFYQISIFLNMLETFISPLNVVVFINVEYTCIHTEDI